MSRKWIVFAAGIGVTVVTLYLSLRGTDFRAIRDALAGADLWLIPPLLACLGVFYFLKVLRWRRLLFERGEPQASLSDLAGPMMIGFAANNVLPFRLGEVIRVLVGARRLRQPYTVVLASVVVERIFDVIALLALGCLAFTFGRSEGMTHPAMPYLGLVLFATSACLLAVAIASGKLATLIERKASDRPGRISGLVAAQARQLDRGLQNVRNPAELTWLLANSILQWLPMAAAILLACKAVDVSIPLSVAVYLLLVVTLAISIPSTPGFVGVIEFGFVFGLGAFDVSPEAAMAAAVFYHVTAWLSVTAVGTLYVHRYSLTWGDLGAEPARQSGA